MIYKNIIALALILSLAGCRAETNNNNSDAKPSDLSPVELIKQKSVSISDAADVDGFVNEIPDRRLVLLGESTHGTSDYYRFRAEVSKKLISEREYSFIAVEGDWASIYRLNRYVKGYDTESSSAKDILKDFSRWPEWMWANEDVAELAEWMREHNAKLPSEKRAGFYGMDVYGQWDALDQLLEYVKENLPEHYTGVRRQTGCFDTFDRDEWQYARAAASRGSSCGEPLSRVVELLKNHKDRLQAEDSDRYFKALQNAYVVKNAESFYRLAAGRGADSWNSRVHHMNDTVNRLLDRYGKNSKAIVWAHNTHVGDSSATEMRQRGQVNIGELTRRNHGPDSVFITGFSCYKGTVLAGTSWGSAMRKMRMPEAMENSVEYLFKKAGVGDSYIIFDDGVRANKEFGEPRGHRAVGVIYNPMNERGNYVQTILPERYDALVYFDRTDELVPVEKE